MSIAIVIPFASEDPHRIRALSFVRGHLAKLFPWPQFVGKTRGEHYSRAAAINHVVESLPPEIDLLLFNDADTLVPPGQIQSAVLQARQEPGIVRAYTLYRRVSREYTEKARYVADILNAPPEAIEWEQDNAVSHGCLALRRSDFEAAGGYDPRFRAYMDDCAFDIVLAAISPNFRRVEGPLYHMWHPRIEPVASDDELYYGRYERQRGDRDALLAIRREAP